MPARSADEIFNDALERRPEEREAFLQTVCAQDEELHARISSLLALHDQLGSFMRAPILEHARAERQTITERLSPDRFSPGQLLGDRYRMEALLGRGGMGEVWRAYDLKLRVDVALKCLHTGLFSTERGLEMLRHEVRSARNVVSPHVCRIFDLVAEDGQELVSMEYVDGRTLQDLLREKAPLPLPEAGEIAAQLLAGLEAIHAADLVHRDVKPANVMITRAGRVVLMDFGLAKGLTDVKEGSIAGTPAYMAPEQARGAALDARADIFAAGVILAEMLTPSDLPSREALWAGIRECPATVPEGPWESVLHKATAWDPHGRYATAREMARALEEVALRTEGIEEHTPYPGLNSFTEQDAEYFFGREAEVEEVWHKLQRLQLSAIIGPSGVGKSSFLHAGLIPSMPEGWRVMVCTPGSMPFKALAQRLAHEVAGDAEAVEQLLNLEEPGVAVRLFGRWRGRHEQALLILDQFEELFTLNPPEVQSHFAQVLGEIALDSDVHVLLSMRDDFLFRCHEFAAFKPIFSDLTPLDALTGNALRRALVQPALACGYRFEDESLVDEMVEEVSDERGALPLLAFATARMWEHRSRSSGTLTRRSHERIGGVGGALAQHAEATMERIGHERWGIVREIFRNLITSQGTRVARTTDELLSVFEDRSAARVVLDQLVDARLLTSFELASNGNGEFDASERHRIELIHESLLRSWPRLVRWQTQEADGAQLRDQLRQAAQLWEQRSQSDDLLWTGTAYRDFEIWRERYPGGITEKEEAFAKAMRARHLRHRRRRRIVVASVVAALLAAVTGYFEFRRQRDEAAFLTRMADAMRLNEAAEMLMEKDNTKALALATASLELADNPDARRLALEALWIAPVRFVLPVPGPLELGHPTALSHDGRWFATADGDHLSVWPRDGGEPLILRIPAMEESDRFLHVFFHSSADYLLGVSCKMVRRIYVRDRVVSLWSLPEGRLVRTWDVPDFGESEQSLWSLYPFLRGDPPEILALHRAADGRSARWIRFALDADEPTDLGSIPYSGRTRLAPNGDSILFAVGNEVFSIGIDELQVSEPRRIGQHESTITTVAFSSDENRFVSTDDTGHIRVWSRDGDRSYEVLSDRQYESDVVYADGFNRSGSHVVYDMRRHYIETCDAALAQSCPVKLSPVRLWAGEPAFTPQDEWIVFPWVDDRWGGGKEVSFYSLAQSRPLVLDVLDAPETQDCKFVADGSRVVTKSNQGELWICEVLSQEYGCKPLWRDPFRMFETFVTEPSGSYVLVNDYYAAERTDSASSSQTSVVPLDGSDPISLPGPQGEIAGVYFDPDHQRVIVAGSAPNTGRPDEPVVLLVTLDGTVADSLRAEGESGFYGAAYLPDGEFLTFGNEGLLLWNLETKEYETLSTRKYLWAWDLDRAKRFLIVSTEDGLALWDLQRRTERILPIPSDPVWSSVAISPDARFVVVGQPNGDVLVHMLDSEQSHLLLGHEAAVTDVWVSPESDEIRSASTDGSVRIWEVPQGRPWHSLPLDELLARLRAQTNLRVVRDVEADDGYRIVFDGFPGWEVPPPSW